MDIENTRKNGLVAVIDWLSFTDVANTNLDSSLGEFGFARDEFMDAEKGAFGYKKMLLHKGSTLRVLYEGNDDMGIHWDCSGTSIRELFCHFKDNMMENTPFGPALDMDADVLKQLLTVIKHVGHVTRLDLAIDDKENPYYTLPELQAVLEEQRFISKFRSWRLVKDSTTSGELVGETIYLGSRRSDIMLRIYDKQLERIAKGINGASDTPWIRWELELKNEYANIVLTDLLQGKDVGALAFGILSNYFRIIVDDDSNKSRCSTEEAWERFLGEVSKIKLFVMQEPATLADKQEWILTQCAPTITGLILANYGDINWLTANLGAHAERMNKHLKKLVTRENPEWEEMLTNYEEVNYG